MTTYINQLPHATQFRITELLLEAGITGEDLENALNSKLSDIADTIDLNEIKEENTMENVKCNGCSNTYKDEVGYEYEGNLIQVELDGETITACPVCKTDEYLMEVE